MNDEEKKDIYFSKQISGMCICLTLLEICKGVEPYNEDYLICPLCESTFCLEKENGHK